MALVKDVLIVANPASGEGRSERALAPIRRALAAEGLRWDEAVSLRKGDLAAACRSAASGYTSLAVVGGDGTVNEVLQEIGPEGPALAIFPAGTANLLAGELGFRADAARIARAIGAGRARRIDLGLCRWSGRDVPPRRFAACAGAGLDAAVVARVAAARTGAIRWTAYLRPLGSLLTGPDRFRVGLAVDGQPWGTGGAAVISNLRRYGKWFRIAPAADPGDGRMDACLFSLDRTGDPFRSVLLAAGGWHAGRPGIRCGQGARFRLDAEGDEVPLQLDGDPAGTLPVEIDLLPGALRVLAGEGEGA